MLKRKEADLNKYLKQLGSRIRSLREDKGLSQEKLGFAAERHRTYICDLEAGTRNPSIKTLYLIADALDTKMLDLLNTNY